MPQRLAQHLIARGLLPARTVDVALKRLAAQGGALDTALLEAGVISEAGMLQAVSDVSGVRLVNLADFEPNAEAAPLMPLKMSRQLNVVPLSLDGNSLHVASVFPIPASQLKDLGFLLGRKLELWVALECRVRDWQSVLYGQRLEPRYAKLLAQLDPTRPAPTEEREVQLGKTESLSADVLERIAQGIVDEPVLLDKPKPRATTETKKPDAAKKPGESSPSSSGIATRASLKTPLPSRAASVSPAPKPVAKVYPSSPSRPPLPPPTPPPLPKALGDDEDEEIRTSVLEPVAYERFARSEHSLPSLVPAEPLSEHENTRVLDLKGYSNFAREVTPSATAAAPTVTPSAPPPPPKISFPGGVLPPRKPGEAPARKAPPPAATFVQPASAVRPSESKARADIIAPKKQTSLSAALPPPSAPPELNDPDLDFSDVNLVLKSPSPRVVVPPEPPALLPPKPPKTPEPVPAAPVVVAPPPPPPAVEPMVPAPAEPAEEVLEASLVEGPPSAAGNETLPFESRPTPPARVPATPAHPAPPAMASAPRSVRNLPPARASAPIVVTQAPIAAVAVSEMLSGQRPPVPSAPPAERPPEPILAAPPGLAGSNALEWSLAQARASLRAATHDREQLVSVILDYGRRTFEYVASFAVMRGAAVGWDGRGDVDVEALRQVAIPLDAASVFRTVALTRGSYVGPLPPDALSQHYLALLSRSPRTVFLWPIEVQSRLVAVLYGDCGSRPVSQRRLADFILFCQDLPNAFHELILYRKQNPQAEQTLTVPTESMPSWGDGGGPQGSEWNQVPQQTTHTEGDAEWFNGLITLLTGPDPSERSMSMLELMKTPDASARALAYAFPGPTGWSRLPVVELPEPDELGPVPGAIARLAQAGASALAPLLDSSDSDTRYLALLTAGSLRYPDVVGGVLRGLFDFEPDISSAARAAASSLKYLPHFQHRMPELRQELLSSDALRRSLAARALGVLHDRESIDSLINLTGSEDELCAQSAADALKELTRASYGTNPTLWAQWYARARDRRRIEWLVDALEADDFDLRLSAIEELSRTFGDNFGFFADGPEAERAGAVARWQGTIAARLDLDL